MECQQLNSELVYFHFGNSTGMARAECEAHLMKCSGCLNDYLELKRNAELPPTAEEVPSALYETKMTAWLQPKSLKFKRPTPLIRRAVPGAAMAAAIILVISGIWHFKYSNTQKINYSSIHSAENEIDTARENPASLNML